jgi:hypothetical protein
MCARVVDRKVEYGNKQKIFLQIMSNISPVIRATVAAAGVSSHVTWAVAIYQVSELASNLLLILQQNSNFSYSSYRYQQK